MKANGRTSVTGSPPVADPEAHLQRAVVRILDRGLTVVGTGFLVAPDLVATCAHVVNQALREKGHDLPSAEKEVTLTVSGGTLDDLVPALVEPAFFRDEDAEDVALLRLKRPLAEGIQPLGLATSEGTEGRELRGWGFPKAGRDGLWMTATVVGPLDDGRGGRRLQLRSTNISPGCSGGPLWDEWGRVVGMAVAIVDQEAMTGRHADTAKAITAEVLAGVCRELSVERGTGAAMLGAAQVLAKLSGVPELPPYFLSRDGPMAAMRALLLAAAEGTARVVVLHGMSGWGKSVVGAAVARDDEVRRAFPEGVFWISIGRGAQRRLAQRQARLARAISGAPEVFEDPEDGRARLGELLRERQCLIVLDDVWEHADVEGFSDLGLRCRMLVTTRNAAVATVLGARRFTLEILSDKDALRFVGSWAEQPPDALPEEARAVARLCGNHPLALAVSAAMVRDGTPWAAVVKALEAKRVSFLEHEGRDVRASLKTSIEALGREAAPYLALAVFADQASIQESILLEFWQHAYGLHDYAGAALLTKLASRALLRVTGVAPDRCVSLHDLQQMYLAEPTPDRAALDAALLAMYQGRCPRGWASGPNDGYFYEHLAHHMAEAGRGDELGVLLTGSPAWMEAKFAACDGDASYLEDLAVWERTMDGARGAARRLDLIRLHAARRVVASRAQVYTDTDLQTLVWLGRRREALSHARLRAEPEFRFDGLWAVHAALEEAGDPAADTLLEELHEQALAIEDPEPLPILRNVALNRTGDVADTLDVARVLEVIGDRSGRLAQLAAALAASGRLREAFEIARGIRCGTSETRVVATRLVITGAGSFGGGEDMSAATARIAARRDDLVRVVGTLADAGELNQALVLAEGLDVPETRSRALVKIAHGRVTANQPQSAWDLAGRIDAPDQRDQVRSEVVAALAQQGQYQEALELAGQLQGASWWARAHMAVFAAWRTREPDNAQRLFLWLLLTCLPLDAAPKAVALIAIAADLANGGDARAESILADAIEAARAHENTAERVDFYCLAVDSAHGARAAAILDEAREIARSIEDPELRISKLYCVARSRVQTCVDGAVIALRDVLSESLSLKNDARRRLVVRDIVREVCRHASELTAAGQTEQGLELAGVPEWAWAKSEVLTAIATKLAARGDPRFSAVFADALATAGTIDLPRIRAHCLGRLALALARARDPKAGPILNETLALEARELVEITNRSPAYDAVARILRRGRGNRSPPAAPHVPPWFDARRRWDDALRALPFPSGTAEHEGQARELAADALAAGRLDELVSAARSSPNTATRPTILAASALALAQRADARAGALFDEARAAARGLRGSQRVAALASVAATRAAAGDARAAADLDEVLAATKEIEIEDIRRETSAHILAEKGLLSDALRTLGALKLDTFLMSLALWADALDRIEPGLSSRGIAEAIRIVGWVRKDWLERV